MSQRFKTTAVLAAVLMLTILVGCGGADGTPTTIPTLTSMPTHSPTPTPTLTPTPAPAPPTIGWEKTFGGVGDEGGFSVQETLDGGYIIAGATNSFGAGEMDLWLVKVAPDGSKTWDKTFGGEGDDWGITVRQTSDGDYVVTGYTSSFGAGGADLWFIKTDAEGSQVWDKTFGGEDFDVGFSVEQTSDGGYIITGATFSFEGSGSGLSDGWIVKTDDIGNELWSQTYGGADYDHCWSTRQTPDGGYVIVGGTDSYGKPGHVWLIKTDANGNKEWEKTFDGQGDDYGFLAHPTPDGGYMLAGTGSCGAGGKDFWLIKTDANGNKEWEKTFGGTNDDNMERAQPTSDGGYIMTGYTYSFGAKDMDAWVVKVDADGNKTWDMIFGGEGEDRGLSVQQTLDGGCIVSGETASYGAGGHDLWLIRLNP